MSQHVPAWKKIGLKLKYAKETADDTPTVSATTETNGASSAGAKRSRDDDSEQENPSKRNKQQATREIRTESPAPRSILSGSQSPTKTPANKKAVSFSAETKAEDGETGQNYFKAWAAGNQPHTPPKPSTEIVVPETPDSAEKASNQAQDSPAEAKTKSKASKRDKKADQAAAKTQDPNVEGMPSLQERRESKAAKKAAKQERKAAEAQSQQAATSTKTSPSSTSTPTAPPSAYLDFLHQFHHDRPNWKFNKSKENHLLKNAWSLYRVPAPYTPALVAYVAGLQGAGARTRLVEGADEVLRDVAEKGGRKFDFNGYEEPATRREAYSSAIESFNETPSATLEQADFDRAARAQAVLTQLLNYAPLPVTIEKPAAAPKPVAPAVQPLASQDKPPVRPPPVMAGAPALPHLPPAPAPSNDRDQRRTVWTAEKIAAAGGAKRIQFDDDDDEDVLAAPKPKPAAAAAKPARRRRKARTDVSSSSEDSSSSDSSSDSSSEDSSSDSDSD